MSDGLVGHVDAARALKADEPRRVRSGQRIDLQALVAKAHDGPAETDTSLEDMDLAPANHSDLLRFYQRRLTIDEVATSSLATPDELVVRVPVWSEGPTVAVFGIAPVGQQDDLERSLRGRENVHRKVGRRRSSSRPRTSHITRKYHRDIVSTVVVKSGTASLRTAAFCSPSAMAHTTTTRSRAALDSGW
jgi:hypothetical protein